MKKTKNMTPSQLTEYYMKSGEASAKKYGFKITASPNERTDVAHLEQLGIKQ
jgi:hypothetical protein